MPPDAIFSIASMTKPMVSVAIMMLHDEGKHFLSDPVGRYFPALANVQVAAMKTDAGGNITVAVARPAFRNGWVDNRRAVVRIAEAWIAVMVLGSAGGDGHRASVGKAPSAYPDST